MSDLSVGQKLWCVPNRRNEQPCEVAVVKVGRKWAEISGRYQGDRIDILTLAVDGGGYSSPAQCYLSREEYEVKAETNRCWYELRKAIDWRPPKPLTIEQIKQAAELLGITIPPPPGQ